MSEEKKDVLHARKFYYLKVLPHPTKDGVKGTKEKAEQMMSALRNLGVIVCLQFDDEPEE